MYLRMDNSLDIVTENEVNRAKFTDMAMMQSGTSKHNYIAIVIPVAIGLNTAQTITGVRNEDLSLLKDIEGIRGPDKIYCISDLNMYFGVCRISFAAFLVEKKDKAR